MGSGGGFGGGWRWAPVVGSMVSGGGFGRGWGFGGEWERERQRE